MYDLVSKKPVARFYYKGSHSHPVRRTVLIIEEQNDLIVGYELRCGKEVRNGNRAKVRSYNKNKIAKWGDYCRLKSNGKSPTKSTLERSELKDLILQGV